NKYFEDELSALRELGAEFAHENPQLARFLGSQSYDPDVERLLEGFAFLTSRLRQKLDDERPELTHSLIALLWPHFLRPIPSMSILEFKPEPDREPETHRIRRGVSIDSKKVDGTTCRFQTCFDVDVMPVYLAGVDYQDTATGYEINMRFELEQGVSFEKSGLEKVRLYLHGETRIAQLLYVWFMHYLDHLVVKVAEPIENQQRLPASAVTAVGFANDEGLLPYPENTFMGYRLLQEYFSFPEKFLFIDVTQLAWVQQFPMARQFELSFSFNRPLDDAIRPTKDNFRLYCTPVVNLFEQDAMPIRLNQREVEYRVRANAENPSHYEVYSIDNVQGWVHGIGAMRDYKAFESFDFEEPHCNTDETDKTSKAESAVFYRARSYPAKVGRGVDTYLSFVNTNDELAIPPAESIVVELTCTNGEIAGKLQSGDIHNSTSSSPDFVSFDNITRVTQALPPPMGPDLHWRLMSNMALNYTSLTNIDTLRTVLSTYNFAAFYDQQVQRASQRRLEGITSIKVEPTHLMFKGLPLRGMRIQIELKESKFSGEGDLYLFATVINEFFALYANMNSFHQLIVRGSEQGEMYQWPARVGQKTAVPIPTTC
ncbi:MAG: type VI secretion system baseplate subunit TssF, partial [Gammaproteobacteria bacterium]|nr:type VI secretion system baseplate subunit TssF [Gammaproteobacteria bacterium]